MPRLSRAEKALRRRVFNLMGVSSSKRLHEATHPDIQRLIGRRHEEPYPLNHAHDLSRLPWEYLPNWIPFKKIEDILKADKKISKTLSKFGEVGEEALGAQVRDALRWRAIKGYEEEWSGLSGADIQKSVVARAGGVPAQANEENATRLAPIIRDKIAKQGKVTLLDVGCGGGGTILPIIEKLSKEERRKVHVVIVDVMEQGLREAEKQLKKLGVKKISSLRTNFYRLGTAMGKLTPPPKAFNPLKLLNDFVLAKRVKRFAGKIDVITSGAAIHHASDLQPVFDAFRDLLASGGVVHFWDWGHHARTSPTIDLDSPELRKRVEVTEGLAPIPRDTITAMNATWLSLWKYEPEAQKLLLKRLEKGGDFNFLDWLRENRKELEKHKGEERGPYCMEGHRPPGLYRKMLERAGFSVEKVFYPLITPETKPHDVANLLYFVHAKAI